MKLTVIILLTFGLLSCKNSTDKNSVDNKPVKDSLVHIDSFYIDVTEINGGSEYKEYYNCDFEKFVNDPNTPKLAKAIYLDKEWNLSNDNEALALLDSLNAKDKSSRQFYFKVVTKTQKKSDGYFSEGLGYAGYNFVLKNTQEFASFFDINLCHTDIDLATWADIIIMEFSIGDEGRFDKPIVENYIRKLKSNCRDCSTTQKETLQKFGFILQEKWTEFLKELN